MQGELEFLSDIVIVPVDDPKLEIGVTRTRQSGIDGTPPKTTYKVKKGSEHEGWARLSGANVAGHKSAESCAGHSGGDLVPAAC